MRCDFAVPRVMERRFPEAEEKSWLEFERTMHLILTIRSPKPGKMKP